MNKCGKQFFTSRKDVSFPFPSNNSLSLYCQLTFSYLNSGHTEEDGGSAQKRQKLDVNWACHRETAEIPSTPLSSRNLNETYDSIPEDSPEKVASSSLNETVTLVSNMDNKCDIRDNQDRNNMNSTFAVEVRVFLKVCFICSVS